MACRIGIDLGSAASVAAYVSPAGVPEVIPNAEGERLTPSWVAFGTDGVLVGSKARSAAERDPAGVVRLPLAHLAEEGFAIKVQGTSYLPQEIAALILGKLRRDAEAFIHQDVEEAVLNVPVEFGQEQRRMLREAAEMAGFRRSRTLDEPIAVAAGCGYEKRGESRLLVYSMGAEMLSVSVVRVVAGRIAISASRSGLHLGGMNFDRFVVEYLIEAFREETGYSLREGAGGPIRPEVAHRLALAAEAAKVQLSDVVQTRVSVPDLVPERGLGLDVVLTRGELEKLVYPTLFKTKDAVEEVLLESGISSRDLDGLILCGGPTRMPVVRRFLSGLVGRDPDATADPQHLAALGAALEANRETRKSILAADVTIGIETSDGRMRPVIAKGTRLPARGQVELTTAEDRQTAINVPLFRGEEAVAARNALIGEMRLDGIEPAAAGVARIIVRIELTGSGMLKATVENALTGRRVGLEIDEALLSAPQPAPPADAPDDVSPREGEG